MIKGIFHAAKTEDIIKQEFFITYLNKQPEPFIIDRVSCILANRKCDKWRDF